MRPIPFKLLTHTATLRHTESSDKFQNTAYSEITLSRVRVEPSTRTAKTKDNTERAFSASLYYDCIRSLPRGTEFVLGDRVIFGGTEYEIGSVEKLYDAARLHHIEIGLM